MKRFFIIALSSIPLAAMMLAAPAAHAAISFDASSTKIFSSSTIATATIAVGSGSNELLIIGIAASGTSATAVTVDGSAATRAIAASSTGQDAEIWYFPNASNASHNVSTTLGTSASGTIIVSSYFGVGTSSVPDASSSAPGNTTKPSSTITTKAANDWVADMVAFAGGDTESGIGTGQTLINTSGTSYERAAASYKSTPPSGATTTSWTLTSGSVRWEEVQFAFKQANPVPTISSLSPNATTTGGATFTLTVNGTNFIASSTVDWNATGLTTTYVSASQITASVPSGDITTATTSAITVVNPAPGGGTSASSTFTVNNAVPTISSLSPASTSAGASTFTLTINGTKFVSSTAVYWNSTSSTALATTTANTATQIKVTIPSGDVATAATDIIYVTNPTPGGGSVSTTLPVYGTGYTWTDQAGNNNWNTAGNWSGDAVPGSGNAAVFSASSTANCTINTTVNVAGIGIVSGYTGTITQSSGDTITIGSSNYSQAAGTFVGSSGGDSITDNGTFTVSSGTFTSTNGTLTLAASTTFSGGTFNDATGTVEFNMSSAITASGSATFYNLEFAGNGPSFTVATGTTLTVQGYFAPNEGSVQLLGGGQISAQGNIETSYNGGYWWNVNATGTVSIVLNGSGTQIVGDTTVFGGVGVVLPNLTIANTGSVTMKNTIEIAGNVTDSSGAVSLGGSSISIYGNFINTNGTAMNPGTSTVIFDCAGTPNNPNDQFISAITASGSTAFYNIELYSGSSFTVATGTTLTVQGYFAPGESGAQLLGGGQISVQGNIETSPSGYWWDVNATGTASIVLTGTSTQIVGDPTVFGGSGLMLPNLTIANTGSVIMENSIDIAGNVTDSSGAVSLGGSTLTIYGNFTDTNGTAMNPGTSTVVFDFNGLPNDTNYQAISAITASGSTAFYNLEFIGGFLPFPLTIATGTTLTVQGYFSPEEPDAPELLGGGQISVQGNIETSVWFHSGATTGTASIVLTGTSTQIVGDPTLNGTSYGLILPDLTIAKPMGTAYAENTVDIAGPVTVSQGEFQLATGTAANYFEVDGPLTVSSGARLSDFPAATSTLELGSSLVNNGVVWFDGSNEACTAILPEYVIINSTTTGHQVPWSGSGNFIIRYAQVEDQGGTAPPAIVDTNGTSEGDNSSAWSFPTGPVVALVQSVSSSAASASSLTLTFPFSPRAGDLVIVPFSERGIGTTHTPLITDTASDTYAASSSFTGYGVGSSELYLQFAKNVNTTSSFSITLSTNGNGSGMISASAFDYTDMNPSSTLDSISDNGSTSAAITSNAVSGHSSNELYFGLMLMTASTTASGSTGWTQGAGVVNNNTLQDLYVETLATSTELTTSSVWTAATSTPYGAALAVFATPYTADAYPASGTLDSATFDTKSSTGAQLNSFTWSGSAASGTDVGFQFAVSNSTSGPWNFEGPSGDGTTYFGYGGSPGSTVKLVSNVGGAGYAMFNGYRYFRYRVTLFADSTLTYTPVVTGVNVNWSP